MTYLVLPKIVPREALLYNEGKLWNKNHQYLAVSLHSSTVPVSMVQVVDKAPVYFSFYLYVLENPPYLSS